MSCGLTSGRTEPCRDNIGGIKNVYLFKYFETNSIVRTGQLVISFPSSEIYLFYQMGASFNETISNDENGEVFEQSLNFRLNKQDVLTTNKLNTVHQIDLRFIVEFYDGSFRIGGLYNGAKITAMDINSGGSKSEGNGYNVTITGRELISAPYIDNLEVITGGVDNYIFMDGNNFIFMDGNNFIFN